MNSYNSSPSSWGQGMNSQYANPYLAGAEQHDGTVAELLVNAGGAMLIVGMAVCLAAGLYYLAEVVEEYTKLTKTVLWVAIQASMVLQVLLLVVDRMPLACVGSGLVAQLCYMQLLQGFPFVPLSDPNFIASAVMLVVNHCLWMQHFLTTYHSMEWIACFFFVVVWMVPFGFMISLAGNDQVLPGSSTPSQYQKNKGTRGALLRLFSVAKEQRDAILPQETLSKGHRA